jgi:hypothetical protein
MLSESQEDCLRTFKIVRKVSQGYQALADVVADAYTEPIKLKMKIEPRTMILNYTTRSVC